MQTRREFLVTSATGLSLAAGCRKLGMNVVARTDPHAAHQDVYDAHPEWIAVDEKGQKRRHWADTDLWVTCALGGYNFEFTDEIRLWLADGVAHNPRPWIVKFNAKPIDKRWLPVVEQFYNWHYRNEKYLRNEKSLAEVAMV